MIKKKEEIEMLIPIGSIDELGLLCEGRDYFEKNKVIHNNSILLRCGLLDLYPPYGKQYKSIS